MKLNVKRILAGLLAGALALSVTGCASSGESSSDASNTVSAGSSTSGTDEKTTIVFAEHVADVQNQAPQVWGVIQSYMKDHPNVVIDVQGTAADEHETKMKLAAQSDSLPDLFYVKVGNGLEMVKAGQLADLTDDILGDEEFAAGFLDNMLDVLKVDGKIYGLPCELQCNGVWYNKRLFDQFGLEIPETYEDLMHCCQVFNENGIIPMARGTTDAWSCWALLNDFCRFGYYDHIDNILAGTENWNNPDYLKFYQKLEEMTEANMWPENVSSIGYWEATELFLGEKAAMFDSGVWDTKKFEQSDFAEDIYFGWGPTYTDGVGNQEISMKPAPHPYVVSGKLQKEDPEKYAAVIDFLKYYYGTEGTRIIVEENQSVPVTKYTGTVDSAEYPVFSRVMEKVGDDLPSPATAPNMYLPGEFEATFFESISGVLNGIYSPEEALTFLDDQMKAMGLV